MGNTPEGVAPGAGLDGEAVEGPARLRDGQVVTIRRMTADDRPLLEEFLSRLSDNSLAGRFFVPVPRATAFVELWCGIASTDRCALLLLTTEGGRPSVVAHAEYVRDGIRAPSAEVAFLVEDDYHGRGCATVLLWRLARAARAAGVRGFHATVLMRNEAMLEVFRRCGYPAEEWWGPDAVQVTMSIAELPEPTFLEPPPGVAPA